MIDWTLMVGFPDCCMFQSCWLIVFLEMLSWVHG